MEVPVNVPGVKAKAAKGEVLTAKRFDVINTFDKPKEVTPKAVKFKAADGKLVISLPPHSVTVVQLVE